MEAYSFFVIGVSILIAGGSVAGYGAAVARVLRIPRPGLGDLVVLGALTAGALVTVVHFAAPIRGGVQAAILAGGAVCAWVRRDIWKAAVWSLEGLYFLAAAAFLVHCAAAAPRASYDTGLYHMQAVRWIQEAATTPGLANIHGRLAFNSLYYKLAALFYIPALGWKSAFSMTPVLAAAGLAGLYAWIARASEAEDGRLSPPAVLAVLATLTLGTVGSLLCLDLSALANDPLVAIVILLLTVQAWAALRNPGSEAAPQMMVATATFAVLVKLSAVFVAAPMVLATAWRIPGSVWRSRAAVGMGLLAGGLACLNAAVLSGCLAYPVGATCLTELPWAVTDATAAKEARMIEWWAKWGPADHAPQDWSWISPWWGNHRQDALVDVCGWLLIGAAVVAGLGLLTGRRLRAGAAWLLGGALAFGSAAWFVTAPDPRFGVGNVLGLCLFLAAVAVAPWLSGWSPKSLQFLLPLGFLAALPFVPEPRLEDWGTPPMVELEPIGHSELGTIHRPVGGDQCWAAPIPCVPEPLSEKAIELFSVSPLP
ncbi:MAG: hypothetical protein GC160_04235 [Acidobacteria bacterium]|nr:hypothetical protein [Acidobacteriota bacterium]